MTREYDKYSSLSSSRPLSGWRVWYPPAAMFFSNGALHGVWAVQIPLTQARLGLAPVVLSIVMLMFGAGAVAAMSGSGWLIHRMGTARLIRISAPFFFALLPFIPLAPNVWRLGVVVFLFGASGGFMDVSMNAAGARVEREAGRPYMSSFHGMWSLGGFAGAGIATLLLKLVGGSLQALIAALIFFAVFAWGQRGLAAGFVVPVSEGRRDAALRPAVRALVIGAMATLSFSGEGAVLNWAAIFLRQYLGADPVLANAGYQAFAIAMAVTRFFGDNVRRRVGGVTLVRAGCLLAFMGLLLGPLTGNTMLAIVGYGLAGIGFANVVPVLLSSAGALPHPEVQVAAVSTMGYAGLLVGPPLLGLVAHVSSLAGIFCVAAAGTVLNAALASACAPPKAKISQSTAI